MPEADKDIQQWGNKLRDFSISACVGYVVTLLLNYLLFRDYGISVRSSLIYIDRPGGYWDIIWVSFISVAVLAVLFSLLLVIIRTIQLPPPIPWIIIVVLAVGISLTVIYWGQRFIGRVDTVQNISGSALESNTYSYVFVRPEKSDRCWLQTPVPLAMDNHNGWHATAYFGGHSNEMFEIIAVNSRIPLHPDSFSRVGAYPCEDIPKTTERFVRIVYQR